MSPLGHNVTLGRECLGLSIPQLAAATGGVVSVRTISALESGRLSDLRTAELMALADALEVWPHELCSELQHYYA
ncbi:helix-turn-helix domain-containing protein [Desertivibrio insolitus]|uniref:helix-turn-helix domain-containing protein n=1 Tax=Herbiconiux sp. SYSU D00978 TaxID=2812562 RepID=UPI001A96E855|nr:helix-turn-helix transcriptional regulator [Herbiconiux sp. SYSU D00978]